MQKVLDGFQGNLAGGWGSEDRLAAGGSGETLDPSLFI